MNGNMTLTTSDTAVDNYTPSRLNNKCTYANLAAAVSNSPEVRCDIILFNMVTSVGSEPVCTYDPMEIQFPTVLD